MLEDRPLGEHVGAGQDARWAREMAPTSFPTRGSQCAVRQRMALVTMKHYISAEERRHSGSMMQ